MHCRSQLQQSSVTENVLSVDEKSKRFASIEQTEQNMFSALSALSAQLSLLSENNQ